MRKLFFLSLLILSFGSFSQKNKLKAYLDTKQFYASELGNYLEIYLQFVGSSVKRTATQSIANTTYTAIAFTAEDWDTDAIHDNSTNNTRLTVPSGKGGKWEISGVVTMAEQSGYRAVRIYKNGSGLISPITCNATTGDNTSLPVSLILDLSAGDYIEVNVYQNSGVSINIQFADTRIQFTYLGA
jgi:hypothetical protein